MPRLRPLWLELGSIAERFPKARGLALACDYDGTLTPIVDHPDQAKLAPRARDVLGRLSQLDDVRIAVLSGRALEDLSNHVSVPGVFLAGTAGLETRDRDGRREVHVDPQQAIPTDLHQDLARWCERFPGSWIENKVFSIALHYRAVAPDQQPAFGAGVRRRARTFSNKVTLVHGKRVFEFMPAAARDKSTALELWLSDAPADTLVMYFGDDTNDEPCYERVRRRSGIAVTVARPVARAEFVVRSTDEVVWFLEWLEREWPARRSAAAQMNAGVTASSIETPIPAATAVSSTHEV